MTTPLILSRWCPAGGHYHCAMPLVKHRNPFLTGWSLHWLLVLALLWMPLAVNAMEQKTVSGDFLAWRSTSGEQPLLEAVPCLGFEDLEGESASGICVAENNYLAHSEAMARAALKDKQAKGPLTAAEQQQLTNLEVLDIARDLALKEACQTQGDACNAARRDLNAAIASYANSGGTNNARLSAAGNQSVIAERNEAIALNNDPKLASQTLLDSFKEFALPQAAGYAGGAVLGKFITEAQAVYAAMKAESAAVGQTASAGVAGTGATDAAVADEVAALRRIGENANGPVLDGKVPNTVLNQQAVNDLAKGKLPGNPIGGASKPNTPREMPSSSNPSATAEDFAIRALGRAPTVAELARGAAMNKGDCPGCWVAANSEGAFVAYRPAGKASVDTAATTATVEVNFKSTGNVINGGEVVKLKFPLAGE